MGDQEFMTHVKVNESKHMVATSDSHENIFHAITLKAWPSQCDYAIAFLIFTPAKKTINPIKKGIFVVPKIWNTIEIITSNNATKQPDDVDQLVN